MTRSTAADVHAAYARAVHAAGLAGIDPSGWHLVAGSQTYGRAYRIWERDSAAGGLSTPRGLHDNVLGMTRAEVTCTLDGMRTAFLAVADVRGGGVA